MPFPVALARTVKESRALLGSIPAKRHHVSLVVFTQALAPARESPARSDLAPGCELGTSVPLQASHFSTASTLIRPLRSYSGLPFLPCCPPTVCHLEVPVVNHRALGLPVESHGAVQGVQAGRSDATDIASQLGPPQVRGIFRPG